MKVWNLIHKGTSAALAVFFYVFYIFYTRTFAIHKYLTVWGLVITVITRIFALLHYLLKINDQSLVTTALCFMQSLNFSIEGTIFVFYWAIFAKIDLPRRIGWYDNSTNIFNHVMCFLLSLIAICLERNNFDRRFYFFGVLVVCLFYLIFLIIYTTTTGNLIYNIITFKSYMTAVYLIAAVVISYIMFYVGFLITKCTDIRYLITYGKELYQPNLFYCCCTIRTHKYTGSELQEIQFNLKPS